MYPGNDAYRVREHLTEAEMDTLLAALKGNRHGHRDLADRTGQRRERCYLALLDDLA
jgi:hypothetical protein